MRGRTIRVAGALAVLVLVAACGSDGDEGVAPDGQGGATSSAAATDDRCGIDVGSPVRGVRLPTGDGDTWGQLVGTGDLSGTPTTAVVLLHQTGPAGLCGWLRLADRMVDDDLWALPLDVCGYGDSTCSDTTPAADQVTAAADWLRDQVGAERIVLMGASMGGWLTVDAVAHGLEVDAWVDLSAPDGFGTPFLTEQAADVRATGLPGLVVMSETDGDAEMRAARRLARDSDARFLDGRNGHGYTMLARLDGSLNRVGREVVAFVRGGAEGPGE